MEFKNSNNDHALLLFRSPVRWLICLQMRSVARYLKYGVQSCIPSSSSSSSPSFSSQETGHGTIKFPPSCDPEQDAQVLRKAMKGFGKRLISLFS